MRCAPDFRRAASQGLSGRGGPGGTSSSGTPTKTSRRRAGGREAVAGGQAGAVEAAGHRPGDACVPRGQLREGDSRGTKLKKKHLLHRLVKKVLIHSRKTVEIWYVLPNSQRFANCNIWLPICNRLRTSPGRVEPEVWFRVVHLAQEGHSGALTRRVSGDRVVSAALPSRGSPKPPREPKTPRVAELLRKAIEWQALLESGTIASQADIARREGVTRARVTRIMGLLRLAPEIRGKILALPDDFHSSSVTERILRPIGAIADQRNQVREFHRFLP